MSATLAPELVSEMHSAEQENLASEMPTQEEAFAAGAGMSVLDQIREAAEANILPSAEELMPEVQSQTVTESGATVTVTTKTEKIKAPDDHNCNTCPPPIIATCSIHQTLANHFKKLNPELGEADIAGKVNERIETVAKRQVEKMRQAEQEERPEQPKKVEPKTVSQALTLDRTTQSPIINETILEATKNISIKAAEPVTETVEAPITITKPTEAPKTIISNTPVQETRVIPQVAMEPILVAKPGKNEKDFSQSIHVASAEKQIKTNIPKLAPQSERIVNNAPPTLGRIESVKPKSIVELAPKPTKDIEVIRKVKKKKKKVIKEVKKPERKQKLQPRTTQQEAVKPQPKPVEQIQTEPAAEPVKKPEPKQVIKPPATVKPVTKTQTLKIPRSKVAAPPTVQEKSQVQQPEPTETQPSIPAPVAQEIPVTVTTNSTLEEETDSSPNAPLPEQEITTQTATEQDTVIVVEESIINAPNLSEAMEVDTNMLDTDVTYTEGLPIAHDSESETFIGIQEPKLDSQDEGFMESAFTIPQDTENTEDFIQPTSELFNNPQPNFEGDTSLQTNMGEEFTPTTETGETFFVENNQDTVAVTAEAESFMQIPTEDLPVEASTLDIQDRTFQATETFTEPAVPTTVFNFAVEQPDVTFEQPQANTDQQPSPKFTAKVTDNADTSEKIEFIPDMNTAEQVWQIPEDTIEATEAALEQDITVFTYTPRETEIPKTESAEMPMTDVEPLVIIPITEITKEQVETLVFTQEEIIPIKENAPEPVNNLPQELELHLDSTTDIELAEEEIITESIEPIKVVEAIPATLPEVIPTIIQELETPPVAVISIKKPEAQAESAEEKTEYEIFTVDKKKFMNLLEFSSDINEVILFMANHKEEKITFEDYPQEYIDEFVSPEELKNDTFGKHDDPGTLVLGYVLHILNIFSTIQLFVTGQNTSDDIQLMEETDSSAAFASAELTL